MSETKPMRERMPGVAAIADTFREWFGRAFVDRQLARATQARRRYVEILREQGLPAAEEWRRINWPEATFHAVEGTMRLGMAVAYPAEQAVTPNIDERILRAAREGGPQAAKRVEAEIARGIVKGRRGVQTSASGADL